MGLPFARANGGLPQRYNQAFGVVIPLAVAWVATMVAVCFATLRWVWPAALVTVAAVVVICWYGQRNHSLVCCIGVQAVALVVVQDTTWSGTITVTVAVLGVIVEPTARRAAAARLRAYRLPGARVSIIDRLRNPMFSADCVAVLVIAVGLTGLISMTVTMFTVIIVVSLGGAVTAWQFVGVRTKRVEKKIARAMRAQAPRYLVYYSGPDEGLYQLTMWLPYFQMTGETGVIVLRNANLIQPMLASAKWPLVYAKTQEALESLVAPSVRAVFYVNNDMQVVHLLRFNQVRHIFLGHGDSDKPENYQPFNTVFDRIFVAGQAAIDRYANHDVSASPGKFTIVGRPQLAELAVRPKGTPKARSPLVLYAPTWGGGLKDARFGSLGRGVEVVTALIASRARVMFRPHPFSQRDPHERALIRKIDELLATHPGAGHILSGDAVEMSIAQCVNASDALVTDVSSLASDYLCTQKPLAVCDTGIVADLEVAYPVTKGAYLLPLGGKISTVIAAMLGDDPKAAARAQVRNYHLGSRTPRRISWDIRPSCAQRD